MAFHLVYFDNEVVKITYEENYDELSKISKLQRALHPGVPQTTLLLSDYLPSPTVRETQLPSPFSTRLERHLTKNTTTTTAPITDSVSMEGGIRKEIEEEWAEDKKCAVADIEDNLFEFGAKANEHTLEDQPYHSSMEYKEIIASPYAHYAPTIRFLLGIPVTPVKQSVLFIKTSLSHEGLVDQLRQVILSLPWYHEFRKMSPFAWKTNTESPIQNQLDDVTPTTTTIPSFTGHCLNSYEPFIPEEEFIPNNVKDKICYLCYDHVHTRCKVYGSIDISGYFQHQSYFPEIQFVNKLFYRDTEQLETIKSIFLQRDYPSMEKVKMVVDALEFIGQIQTTFTSKMQPIDPSQFDAILSQLFSRSRASVCDVETAFETLKTFLQMNHISMGNSYNLQTQLDIGLGKLGAHIIHTANEGKKEYHNIKINEWATDPSHRLHASYHCKMKEYSFS